MTKPLFLRHTRSPAWVERLMQGMGGQVVLNESVGHLDLAVRDGQHPEHWRAATLRSWEVMTVAPIESADPEAAISAAAPSCAAANENPHIVSPG